MNQEKYKYIIIGGGLSGLSAALQFKLNGENDFIIIESRDRVGGRVLTTGEVDLGATWLHHNHSTLFNVLEHLEIQKFRQHTCGKSLYVTNSGDPVQEFEIGESEPPSYRVNGGTAELIKAMAEKNGDKIILNEVVIEILESENSIHVKTKNQTFLADKLIVTVPPRLASTITFLPKLPEDLFAEMRATHTWFSHAIKVGITFKQPFWRQTNKSGMLIDQTGDVIEIHDHTNESESQFTLMGFVNERLRDLELSEQKLRILNSLERYFGEEIHNYLDFNIYDWSKEEFTTGVVGLPIPRKTTYGHPVFQKAYYNSKLYFAGTETSNYAGGFMEGAVYSGLSLAQKLIEK